MVIELLHIHFHLEGCRSLKEKRQRVAGLRDRVGRNPNLAITEFSMHDSHSQSQWCIVAAAGDRGVAAGLLENVLGWASRTVDAVIVDAHRAVLPYQPDGSLSSRQR